MQEGTIQITVRTRILIVEDQFSNLLKKGKNSLFKFWDKCEISTLVSKC